MKKLISIQNPFQLLTAIILVIILTCNCSSPVPQEYFVAKNGSDSNPGTIRKPFLSINKAATIAKPGDTITVNEGIYREWVNPPRSGSSDKRITYRAAKGADVRILGSEIASGWQKDTNGIWKINLPKEFFGEFNPFNTITRHPQEVKIDESGDGWGWLKYGRWTHLGDVYINGTGLTEKQSYASLLDTTLTWFAEVDSTSGTTSVWSNFGANQPNGSNVEVNVRPFAFFPEKTGISYISLQGFTIMNVASHWAPPTVFQPAAVGVNGSKGWVIEENIIMYAKGLGISIGIPSEEVEPKRCGHHIIKNNVILRCGQGGMAGQEYNDYSVVSGNYIGEINYREEFGGWETAAIKFHQGDSMIIHDNFIKGVYSKDPEKGAAHGIWNDFKNTNWRVSNNIVSACESHPILAEANWTGPNLYENNVLIGSKIGIYSSRSDAWVHNLFINSGIKPENQTWGERVPVSNQRWLNNIFTGQGLDFELPLDETVMNGNVFYDNAKPNNMEKDAVVINGSSKVSVEENANAFVLNLYYSDSLFNSSFQLADASSLELPFSFNANALQDFYGVARNNGNVIPGPFSNVKKGVNRFILYEYPPLYFKALKLIDKK